MTSKEVDELIRWGTNPERTSLKRAYWDGRNAALGVLGVPKTARALFPAADVHAPWNPRTPYLFKVAGPMGADAGVQPKGDEVSHGTARNEYPAQDQGTSAARADMPDWLWDIFTSYDQIAPGRADGTFGQETIG